MFNICINAVIPKTSGRPDSFAISLDGHATTSLDVDGDLLQCSTIYDLDALAS